MTQQNKVQRQSVLKAWTVRILDGTRLQPEGDTLYHPR